MLETMSYDIFFPTLRIIVTYSVYAAPRSSLPESVRYYRNEIMQNTGQRIPRYRTEGIYSRRKFNGLPFATSCTT